MALSRSDGTLSTSTPSLKGSLAFRLDRVGSKSIRTGQTAGGNEHQSRVDLLKDPSRRSLGGEQDAKGLVNRDRKRARSSLGGKLTGTSWTSCSLSKITPEERLAREVQTCISKSAKRSCYNADFKRFRYFSDEALSLDEEDAQCSSDPIGDYGEAQTKCNVAGGEPGLRGEPVPLYTDDCKVPKRFRRVAVPYTITNRVGDLPSQFYWSIINTQHLQRNPNKRGCCLCQSPGHSIRACPTRACAYCGSRCHSELVKCPYFDVVCEFCTGAGHPSSRCPQRLAAASIELQHERTIEASSDVARDRFDLIGRRRCLTCGKEGDSFYCAPCQKTNRSSVVRPQIWLFCSFCGARGHTYHTCRRRRESRLLKAQNSSAPRVTENAREPHGDARKPKIWQLDTSRHHTPERCHQERLSLIGDGGSIPSAPKSLASGVTNSSIPPLPTLRTTSASSSRGVADGLFPRSSTAVMSLTREELKNERKRDRKAIKAQKRQRRQASKKRQHAKGETRCGSRATARLCTTPVQPNRHTTNSSESILNAALTTNRKKTRKNDVCKKTAASQGSTCVFPKRACRIRKRNS